MKLNEITGKQAETASRHYSRGQEASNDGREKYYIGGGYFATEADAYDYDDDTNYYYVYRLLDNTRMGTLTVSSFNGYSIEIEVIGFDGKHHEAQKELDDHTDIEESLPWFKEQIMKFKKEGIIE